MREREVKVADNEETERLSETKSERRSSVLASPMRLFFFAYGFFLDAFTAFETLIEMLLKDQLRLTNEETTITFSSVGFGAKFSILCALLNRDVANDKKVELLQKAVSAARRNSFAHGFMLPDAWHRTFTLVQRDVKNNYRATVRHMTPELMEEHAAAFYAVVNELLAVCELTHDDVFAYQRWIAENAPKRKSDSDSKGD